MHTPRAAYNFFLYRRCQFANIAVAHVNPDPATVIITLDTTTFCTFYTLIYLEKCVSHIRVLGTVPSCIEVESHTRMNKREGENHSQSGTLDILYICIESVRLIP